MMNFILYIKTTDTPEYNYQTNLYDPGTGNTTFLDIDNHSDIALIQYAMKALDENDRCCIILDICSDKEIGRLLSLATKIADNPSKCRVFVNGKDTMLQRLLFPQENFIWHQLSDSEIKKRIMDFFSNK